MTESLLLGVAAQCADLLKHGYAVPAELSAGELVYGRLFATLSSAVGADPTVVAVFLPVDGAERVGLVGLSRACVCVEETARAGALTGCVHFYSKAQDTRSVKHGEREKDDMNKQVRQ